MIGQRWLFMITKCGSSEAAIQTTFRLATITSSTTFTTITRGIPDPLIQPSKSTEDLCSATLPDCTLLPGEGQTKPVQFSEWEVAVGPSWAKWLLLLDTRIISQVERLLAVSLTSEKSKNGIKQLFSKKTQQFRKSQSRRRSLPSLNQHWPRIRVS